MRKTAHNLVPSGTSAGADHRLIVNEDMRHDTIGPADTNALWLSRPPELLNNPYFRTVWERASDAMALSDADGIVIAANPAYLHLYEYKPEEVIGQSFSIIFPEQARPQAIEQYKAVFAASGATPHVAAQATDDDPYFESTVRRGDGEVRTVQSRIEYIYENNQRVTMLSIIRDITEQKQAQVQLEELNATLEQRVQGRTTELERSNRELDQFAHIASHDLKAPLRAITNLAAWVSQDAAEVLPATSQEHLAKLRGRIKRMEVLLDDLLAYSRAGRQRHSPEPVNVTALVQTVVDLLAPPPGFVVKSSASIPLLRAERVPLEIVLRNLIGNAFKHHPQPSTGRVDITAQLQGQWAEFSVIDNGSGIDPAFHERVFEIFRTLKARDEVEGSGMGLTVVKKLVESRGGTIQVISSVGEGATFRFTWPATAMPEAVDVQTAAGSEQLNESSNNEGALA
jgi:PAS domain S-box-containing protein